MIFFSAILESTWHILLDSCFSFACTIQSIGKSYRLCLSYIQKRPPLIPFTASALVVAIVPFRSDYCSNLLTDLPAPDFASTNSIFKTKN